jgi:hypothetical protein
MSTDLKRTCPSCGNEFSGAMEFCPVCMLRGALVGGVQSGESSFESAVEPTPDQPGWRFDHYEVLAVSAENVDLAFVCHGSGSARKKFDNTFLR